MDDEQKQRDLFVKTLRFIMSEVFDEHGYGARPHALDDILACPFPVRVTGGIMVRAQLGKFFTDIDVFVHDKNVDGVAEYLSNTLRVPIVESKKKYYPNSKRCVHLGTVVDIVGVSDLDTAIKNFDISICRAYITNDYSCFFPVGFTDGISSAKTSATPQRVQKYKDRGVKFIEFPEYAPVATKEAASVSSTSLFSIADVARELGGAFGVHVLLDILQAPGVDQMKADERLAKVSEMLHGKSADEVRALVAKANEEKVRRLRKKRAADEKLDADANANTKVKFKDDRSENQARIVGAAMQGDKVGTTDVLKDVVQRLRECQATLDALLQ